MTKPEDVSEGAWDAAGKAMGSPSFTPETVRIRVARAIMAAEQREREACAGLAARDANSHDATTNHQTAEWLHDTNIAVRTADRIAAAILNRGENQGD